MTLACPRSRRTTVTTCRQSQENSPKLPPHRGTAGSSKADSGKRPCSPTYIRYYDGSEELYDLEKDPNEWTNLAQRVEYDDVKKGLALWLPKSNAEPATSAGAPKKKRKKSAR
jgi:hypothetical protein